MKTKRSLIAKSPNSRSKLKKITPPTLYQHNNFIKKSASIKEEKAPRYRQRRALFYIVPRRKNNSPTTLQEKERERERNDERKKTRSKKRNPIKAEAARGRRKKIKIQFPVIDIHKSFPTTSNHDRTSMSSGPRFLISWRKSGGSPSWRALSPSAGAPTPLYYIDLPYINGRRG